jgi:predicted RNase H-like nuclease (RuvC/YqgF family)
MDGAALNGETNCHHDHQHDRREDEQDIGVRADSANLPDAVTEEIARLKAENSRLKKILVQRDLEIYAVRNELQKLSSCHTG